MTQVCENIIEENEVLKLLKNTKDINKKIFEFIQKDYEIHNLKIIIKNNNDSKVLYNHKKEDLDFFWELEYLQNVNTKLIFILSTNNKEKKEEIDKYIFNIKLKFQLFSQTLYNKFLEESIRKLSLVDNVTGLFNRAYLDNYAENILNISNREGKKIAFLKVGIDQFKAVIDEFDYNIGDKVLKSLANTLKENVRTSDIVIKIDSDEFLVILLNVINEENAMMISEKLINNFSQEKVIVNEKTKQSLMKTICSGISIYPDDANDIDDIVRKSDIALYEARNLGRSKTFKYSVDDSNTIDLF